MQVMFMAIKYSESMIIQTPAVYWSGGTSPNVYIVAVFVGGRGVWSLYTTKDSTDEPRVAYTHHAEGCL